MSNNSLKFLFLFVAIGAILFSRTAYPHFPIVQQLSANEAQSISASSPANPPVVALSSPTTSSEGEVPTSDTPLNYIASGSTTEFSKIASTTPPAISDAESLITDLTDGSPLLAVNANARWPMASLTKLMTAVIVNDDLSQAQRATVTQADFSIDPQEYTLQVGGTYTVADLLRVLLLPSSNVAAETLAESYGRAQFLAAMNAQAAQWGMTNTYYDDPSGLSAANQSTAHDLMLLAQHVYADYPQILAITRNVQVTITNLSDEQKILVKNINNFAGAPDFIGGKTGHTNEASGNLLTIFNFKGHPLLVLVLGTDDRFGDTQKLYAWVKTDFN